MHNIRLDAVGWCSFKGFFNELPTHSLTVDCDRMQCDGFENPYGFQEASAGSIVLNTLEYLGYLSGTVMKWFNLG